MTHELKTLIETAITWEKEGLKAVLATVVALDGSSYRRPGVRMLLNNNGHWVGAVSGGCVEKEVYRESQSVFETGVAKMMTYDGRYRLGCEGILYILLEPIALIDGFIDAFFYCLNDRTEFTLTTYYHKKEGVFPGLGSVMHLNNMAFSLQGEDVAENRQGTQEALIFKQSMTPCFKLIIVGAEHDAVKLSQYASFTGWEVTVVAKATETKSNRYFPGATMVQTMVPEEISNLVIDDQTAVVLMTHNFAMDLRYLVALKDKSPNYIGLLGSTRRRDDLLSQLIEYCPEISDEFLEVIYGPAGIDIGSETPEEIAISIVSEILAVTRDRETYSLRKKSGKIHSKSK
ncbi:XdhC family protein [Aestuariibaculum suncheonense]|uniref:XdhC family protein n=1 Tax=Aestuariibaculum suncheonense TaxID=1028745 RepID=A0A8J6UBE7_9FLAO|nr:XdhC/CoxI family protein [Aestuariibaculum suncheonense]MBD0835830.1 XdhC family protein [Aestuariibaculum suncheonense]